MISQTEAVALVVRFIAAAVVSAAIVSGCGGTASRTVVHVNGAQTGDYVAEMSASGIHFLVPTGVFADQGTNTFQVVVPTLAYGRVGQGPSSAGPWGTQAFATAVIPRSAKVEILATGSPGLTFRLSWEDTCGGTRVGKQGAAGGNGGQGQLALRSPAVVAVKMPAPVGDYNGCYLATDAWARKRSELRVEIIDY